MSLGQFISILRARWWVALLVFLLTVAATVVASLLMTKQYTATASVVVDFKPDPVSAAVFGIPSPTVMATQVDILTSERVALRVVRNLRLNENPQVRQQWLDEAKGTGTIEQWLVQLFSKNLTVEPSRDSSVIRVSYQSPDPRFAAALANAFVQAYTQTALELRVNPARQYSGFFDTQVKELREALEKAQTKLSDFQRANGIIATDERLDVETARLNDLSSQLVALQAVASESRSRQAQANSSSGDRLQEVVTNPLISSIKGDITRTEAKLEELNASLGERHPQVLETQATLDSLRSRLALETRRVAGSVGVTSTINNQREAQVKASLEAQRAKVLKMKALRDEGMVLVRDLENAQRSYDTVQARLAQTSLESQTTQSNINVLTEATPPVEASSPKLLLNVALSIVLGGLLAMGTALVLELLDRRVRSTDDVVAALDLPVIGLMQKPGSASRRLSAMQKRLLAPQTSALPKGA
jgi:succinoglycan biosynthesis transport protein ExoP